MAAARTSAGDDLIRSAPAAEKHQRRPDALARDIQAILHQAADLRLKAGELGPQEAVQLAHVRLEPDKQFANPKAEGALRSGRCERSFRADARWFSGNG